MSGDIKTLIFDFDGTLCELVHVHYVSLNKAIQQVCGSEYIISEQEQIHYNGLSTKTKLIELNKHKNLPKHHFDEIQNLKQFYTAKAIEENLSYKEDLVETFKKLKNDGFKIFCASNAIRQTIEAGLKKIGIFSFFDGILSNEDVSLQKPNPEIYLKTFILAKSDPKECLIIEDAKHGREAAYRSGAFVCEVDNESQTTYSLIKKRIKQVSYVKNKWCAKNTLNILIPCAGAGSRFANAGYTKPKPLIDVNGFPMIKTVIDNLNIDANYIFVVQKSHYEQYHLDTILPLIASNCKIVLTHGLTEGAACTALLAKEYIDNDKHLLIANSDQYVNWDSADFLWDALSRDLDGSILTFKATGNKWSYVKLQDGYVTEVAEKVEISDIATVGIYYFDKGSDYIKYSKKMIENKTKFNNEYYIAPVYNEMIKDNKKIGIKYCKEMFGIGTPEDLEYFLNKNELVT